MSCKQCRVKRPSKSELKMFGKACDHCGADMKLVKLANGECSNCGSEIYDYFYRCKKMKGTFADDPEIHSTHAVT